MSKGLWMGVGAYLIWGFLLIYWKILIAVPALEIVSHRTVWSLVFVAALLTWRRNWRWLKLTIRDPRIMLTLVLAAALLGANWSIYVWGVNAGYVVETSLGYFINPLVSVLLGVVFLHERLRSGQWLAIVIAATGVIYLTLNYGSLPWIALSLAFSFGTYGLLKKISSLNTMEGLFLETFFMSIPALAYLMYLEITGTGAFGHLSTGTTLLLMFTGVATAIPLLMFASAARQIPLSMVGILQYMTPTLQFLLGILVYHEPFSHARLIGFSIIWLALIVFTVEGFWARKKLLQPQYAN